ncbi:MAG: hypothetical protein LBB18_04070 [Puniceicoccales bacterium]|jgi:hypothetical protein|nr:hypothetical protein [Puniceicoccales bacterium]
MNTIHRVEDIMKIGETLLSGTCDVGVSGANGRVVPCLGTRGSIGEKTCFLIKILIKRMSAMLDAIQAAFVKTPEQIKQEMLKEEENKLAA